MDQPSTTTTAATTTTIWTHVSSSLTFTTFPNVPSPRVARILSETFKKSLTYCQFHQHFTRAFCTNILAQKMWYSILRKWIKKTRVFVTYICAHRFRWRHQVCKTSGRPRHLELSDHSEKYNLKTNFKDFILFLALIMLRLTRLCTPLQSLFNHIIARS